MVDRKELEWVPVNDPGATKGTTKKISDSKTISVHTESQGFILDIGTERKQKENPIHQPLNQKRLPNEQDSPNTVQNTRTEDQDSHNSIKNSQTQDQDSPNSIQNDQTEDQEYPITIQNAQTDDQDSPNFIKNAQNENQNSPNSINFSEADDLETESERQFFLIEKYQADQQYSPGYESITIEEDFVNKDEELFMEDDKPFNGDQDFLWRDKESEHETKESLIAEISVGDNESHSEKNNPIPFVQLSDSDNSLLTDQDSRPVINELSTADNNSHPGCENSCPLIEISDSDDDDREQESILDDQPLSTELLEQDLSNEEDVNEYEVEESQTTTQSQIIEQASGSQSQPNVLSSRLRKRQISHREDSDDEYEPAKTDFRNKCTICSKTFSFETGLKYHLEQHKNKNKFYCELCQRFVWVTKKKLHVKQHEKAGSKFKCDTCQRICLRQAYLEQHRLTHQEAQYPCRKCSKKFVSKTNLKVHMAKMHSAQGSFPCTVCQKIFKSKLSLTHHQKYRH